MGLFDRVEQTLERVVNGAFARAFKAEVQPVEISSAIRRAMDDRAAVVSQGRTIVPNVFTVELAPSDHDRLRDYDDFLRTEFIASAQEHAESQGYIASGPIVVQFVEKDDLDTGVFRVLPTSASRPEPPADKNPGRRTPRNSPFPPHASAPAEGDIALAGSAAAAAAAAAAGTAAAARAGGRTPRDEPYGDVPHGYTDARRRPSDDDELRRHNAQRASDLAAWPDDDEADAHAGNEDNAAAEHPSHDWAPPRPERPERHDSAEPRERYEADPPRVLARRPWLELGVDSYPLLSAITVIGRDASADITLEDSGISRRHCEIRVTHDGPRIIASIRDLGSTNGTFVNGENVRSARLVEGDRITVGRSSLSVRFGER